MTCAAPSLPRCAALGSGLGGQRRLLVDSASARAELYLHGAHLTSWRPTGHDEVLFLSPRAIFDGKTAIRGGIPLIAPWFGPGIDGDQSPSHGWARINEWELRSVRADSNGDVAVVASYRHGDMTALMTCVMGQTLHMGLSLRNDGSSTRTVETALHTYLRVGDISAVTVNGVDGCRYLDSLTGETRVQSGPVTFPGAVNRIYDMSPHVYSGGVGESLTSITVDDPKLGREITVVSEDAPNAVIWNPWREAAQATADMDAADFATMVCVETARIRDHAAVLAPGESTAIGMTLTVSPRQNVR